MQRIAWAALLVLGSAAITLEEIACKQVSVASLDPDGGPPDGGPTPAGPDAGENATSVPEAGVPACSQSVVQAGFDDLDGGVTADFASAIVSETDGGLTVSGAESHAGEGSLRVIPTNGSAFLEVPLEAPLAPGDHCVQMTFFIRLEQPLTSPLDGPGIAERDTSGPFGAVQVEIAPGDVPSLFVVQTSHGTVIQTDNVGHFEDSQWHKVRITTTTTRTMPGNVRVFLDELPPLETPLAIDLTADDAGATSLVAWLGITKGSPPAELYLDDVAIDIGH